MEFVALAHEEGVSTGPESWLGPLLFFAIILVSVAVGKLIAKRKEVERSA